MRVIIFLFLILLSTQNLLACTCIGKSTVKRGIKSSDVVATGVVISREVLKPADGATSISWARVKYEIKIEQLFKGKITTDTLLIYTGMGGGDCGYPFEVGCNYIIYGYSEASFDPGPKLPSGEINFWTDICSRTVEFNDTELSEIKKVTRKK